jgi:hypothetical protein
MGEKPEKCHRFLSDRLVFSDRVEEFWGYWFPSGGGLADAFLAAWGGMSEEQREQVRRCSCLTHVSELPGWRASEDVRQAFPGHTTDMN